MAKEEGQIKFTGHLNWAAIATFVGLLVTGGTKIVSLQETVKTQEKRIEHLEESCQKFSDLLPRIETKLDNIKALLDEVREVTK